jgi:hypothetical protein
MSGVRRAHAAAVRGDGLGRGAGAPGADEGKPGATSAPALGRLTAARWRSRRRGEVRARHVGVAGCMPSRARARDTRAEGRPSGDSRVAKSPASVRE